MAGRPAKQTVNYFPHYCVHKETMFILEQEYQSLGYAFWFKLLELLGRTEGHKIDLGNGNEPIWRYLQALTYTDHDKCKEILDLLATLQAIDRELWADHQLIWCQNFVDGVADAYQKRIVDIPQRPNFGGRKTTSDSISGDGKQQNRLDKNRLDKNRLDNTILDKNISSPLLSALSTEYEKNINVLTPRLAEQFNEFVTEFPTCPIEWIGEAFKEAVTHEARNWAYVSKILKTWKTKGRGNGLSAANNKQQKGALPTTEELKRQVEGYKKR